MDTLQTIQDFFRHMEWADARVWSALMANREAASDASLRERLYHIHMVQRAFLKVWKGEPLNFSAEGFSESSELMAWARAYYAEAAEYLKDLGQMDLERPVVMPWIERFEQRLGRKADAPTFHETLLQVAMHSVHHRGQVNTKLRELGCEPPLMDYIVWIWAGKPEADWPQ